MKRLTLLTAILLARPVAAQDIRYETDEQCGCDILYVDGIETTKETDSDGTVRYGFRREDGRVIVPNRYKYADTFHGAYCKVWLEDTLCGLIDTTGREILPCIYRAVQYPSENRIVIQYNNRLGYTDLSGNIVIPPQYYEATPFSEERAAVVLMIDEFTFRCTYIDTLGRQLFDPVFESALPYIDGYAPIRRYDRWGMIDRQGNEVLTTKYEYLSTADHGTFFAGDEFGMALFDYSFLPLTPFHYKPSTLTFDNRIGVERNGKYGFLDPSGREAIPCIYDETSPFRLGRAMVRIGEHYGIIDTAGNYILPLEYESRVNSRNKYTYHDSLALVEKNGRLGYVDLDGNLAIPMHFSDAFPFREGLAAVMFNNLWGYIDTRGDIYLPFIFNIASPFEYGRAEIIFDGQIRYIDRKGRCVKNCGNIVAFR